LNKESGKIETGVVYYTDTDSVIFTLPEGMDFKDERWYNSDELGCLKNELEVNLDNNGNVKPAGRLKVAANKSYSIQSYNE
jgi:hypothetical protein